MNFSSKGLDTAEKKFGPSKYITYGIQNLKINKLEIKVASTGSKQVIFSVEGLPVKEADFQGVDGANGPVGRISTMYMKPESEKDLIMLFGKISDALGLRDKLDAIESSTLEEYVQQVEKLIVGKFANFVVATQQYWDNTSGKAKNSYRFPKFDFVENKDANPSKLKFDIANKYHFEAAVVPSSIGTPSSPSVVRADKDDLPF